METIFSKVGLTLVGVLPKDWERALLFAQITDGSYELFYYVKVKGAYYSNFDLEKTEFDISRKEVRECFKSIYDTLLPDYHEKGWYAMTYILSKSGEFTVDYEYTDYSEDSLSYKKIWKEKYLGKQS